MDTFLGLTDIQWTGINVIAVVIGTLIILITVLIGFIQVRQAFRSLQFGAVNRLQELIDNFREDRNRLFSSIPLNLALQNKQFPHKPPGKHKKFKITEGERREMLLTNEQKKILRELSDEDIELARKIIIHLNDIGQLVEDGYIPKKVFFGKYHMLILRCCHLVEPIRRLIEERHEGGNFGQRILRIRHRAARYHDIHPKHRDVAVYISNKKNKVLIYESEKILTIEKLKRPFYRFLKLY